MRQHLGWINFTTKNDSPMALCREIQNSSSVSGVSFWNAAVAGPFKNAIQVSLILQYRSQLVAIHGKLPLVKPESNHSASCLPLPNSHNNRCFHPPYCTGSALLMTRLLDI